MRRFLIVDDAAFRIDEYIAFRKQFEASHGIQIIPVATPRKAMEVLVEHVDRFEGGVIADFALGAHRDDDETARLRYRTTDAASGEEYTISTGLGILDWVYQHSPGTPLWALTEGGAAHAPLFMSAANLWLDANPLQVMRFSDSPTAQARLAEELCNPAMAEALNPAYDAVVNESSVSFNTLIDTPYEGIEPIVWLHALATLPRPTRRHGFEEIVKSRIEELTGRDDVKIHFHRGFSACLAYWQRYLQQMYDQFPDVKRDQRWPDADPDAKNLKAWNDYNPFSDYFGTKRECREFVEAQDVRMALARWRRRNETTS